MLAQRKKNKTWHNLIPHWSFPVIMKAHTWEICGSVLTSFLTLSPQCHQQKPHPPWTCNCYFFSKKQSGPADVTELKHVIMPHTHTLTHSSDTPRIKAFKFRYQFNPKGIKHTSSEKQASKLQYDAYRAFYSLQTCYMLKLVSDMLQCEMDDRCHCRDQICKLKSFTHVKLF